MPALGVGTWRVGEAAAHRSAELEALRLAFEVGYRLVDTAEGYGGGAAEQLVGEALSQAVRGGLARESLFIVSKVAPQNADARGLARACEGSLRRLGLDHLDLYLLHWRGAVPLDETVRGFESLLGRGWIRGWGVCSFGLDDMKALRRLGSGSRCALNQMHFSLAERGAETDLLPWQRRFGVPLMAGSPLERGTLAKHPALHLLARRIGTTPARLALAWLIDQGVAVVPKASHAVHLADNFGALAQNLDDFTRAALQRLFPPPPRRKGLLAA